MKLGTPSTQGINATPKHSPRDVIMTTVKELAVKELSLPEVLVLWV